MNNTSMKVYLILGAIVVLVLFFAVFGTGTEFPWEQTIDGP